MPRLPNDDGYLTRTFAAIEHEDERPTSDTIGCETADLSAEDAILADCEALVAAGHATWVVANDTFPADAS